MRCSLALVAGMIAAAVAAPAQPPSTGLEKRCFPDCKATQPSPSLPSIGLAIQVGIWAQVDVPYAIANLANMVATGDVRNADNAQQALLNLRAKIQKAVKMLDSETAKLALSLVVRLDIANNGVAADDSNALISIDATIKALASLQASIADGDFSQLAADLTVLVKLRLQLENFVPRTVGSTRSSCNTNLAHIDVSAQLLSRLPGPVLTNLDTAVRTGNQAQSSSSFKNAAELGGALRTGVSVGGPYSGPSQSALVQLNAGIQNAVNVLLNTAKAAASGNSKTAIQGSLALLSIARGYVDASLFGSIDASIASLTSALKSA